MNRDMVLHGGTENHTEVRPMSLRFVFGFGGGGFVKEPDLTSLPGPVHILLSLLFC